MAFNAHAQVDSIHSDMEIRLARRWYPGPPFLSIIKDYDYHFENDSLYTEHEWVKRRAKGLMIAYKDLPEAQQDLKRYKFWRTFGLIQFIAVPVCVTAAIVVELNTDYSKNYVGPNQTVDDLLHVGLFVLPTTGTISYSFIAPSHLKKSVNKFNKSRKKNQP